MRTVWSSQYSMYVHVRTYIHITGAVHVQFMLVCLYAEIEWLFAS